MRIIMKFSNQNLKIRNIVKKIWHLLSMDTSIGKFVPSTPLIMYRRATSIRDRIIQSEFRGTNIKDLCKYNEIYYVAVLKSMGINVK